MKEQSVVYDSYLLIIGQSLKHNKAKRVELNAQQGEWSVAEQGIN